MPFDPKVTVAVAEEARTAKLAIAKGRRIPTMLGMIDELKKKTTYRIFNVGPWAQVINAGSVGTYLIPPCPEGEEYVEPKVIAGVYPIPAIVDELIIKNEAEMDRLMDDGWKFVQEICGVNVRGQSDAHSIRHMGVFPSKNEEPTKQELYEANLLLKEKCSEIIRDIRDIYATDRKLFGKIVDPKIHYVAARILNITDDVWMVDAAPQGRVKCRYCKKANDADAVTCHNCGELIDPERYAELKRQDEEAINGPKRPRGRPKKAENEPESDD